jgi:hypothetical protein
VRLSAKGWPGSNAAVRDRSETTPGWSGLVARRDRQARRDVGVDFPMEWLTTARVGPGSSVMVGRVELEQEAPVPASPLAPPLPMSALLREEQAVVVRRRRSQGLFVHSSYQLLGARQDRAAGDSGEHFGSADVGPEIGVSGDASLVRSRMCRDAPIETQDVLRDVKQVRADADASQPLSYLGHAVVGCAEDAAVERVACPPDAGDETVVNWSGSNSGWQGRRRSQSGTPWV